MNPTEEIFRAYEEGYSAILLTGRSLYELTVEERKIRPLIQVIKNQARKRGLSTITYSRANGIEYEAPELTEKDRRLLESALKAHRLLEIEQNENEIARVMRGLSSLCRTPTEGLRWSDGKPMKFLVLIEFAEHNVPGGLQNGTQLDHQLLAIEYAYLVSQSLALRSSGNLMVFHSNRGGMLIDNQVAGALRQIHLRQPDVIEKQQFLAAATSLYTSARFEDGLAPEVITHLTTNTPNRSLEELLRKSHRTDSVITAKALAEQKARDIEALSEHTLRVLDTSPIENVRLVGRNIEAPKRIMDRLADGLKRGNPHMPGNILLAGSPSTGKTNLARYVASRAEVIALEILSPKSSWVGETERRVRLQQDILLKELIPNIAFCDEINSVIPMERTGAAGDSGASQAVFAAFLTALSDDTKRGKSLLIGTTNDPTKMSDAMRSRFTVIPVLSPLKEDYAKILIAIAGRSGVTLDSTDPKIREAADIFFQKGANPRKIQEALDNAILLKDELSPETALFAAHDKCVFEDRLSTVFADLVAIKAASLKSFLPWGDNPSSYPYPEHLSGIVDAASGEIAERELNRRIAELQPYANV